MAEKKVLTQNDIAKLLNRSWSIVEVFNYTNNQWMKRFVGNESYTADDMRQIYDFRDHVEKVPYMAGHELAALAVSLTCASDLRLWGFCPKNVREVANPYSIINIITYNAMTGKYETNPSGWFGQGCKDSYIGLEHAEKHATRDFMRIMIQAPYVLNKFLGGYNKSR